MALRVQLQYSAEVTAYMLSYLCNRHVVVAAGYQATGVLWEFVACSYSCLLRHGLHLAYAVHAIPGDGWRPKTKSHRP